MKSVLKLNISLMTALIAVLTVPMPALAQGASTLGNLIFPRGGKLAHFSSNDPAGGNGDFRGVAPGQTYTLVDTKGAGIVRRWWITLAPRNNAQIQRQAIIRCYWDGETSPSVEVPVSDFFGMGFGLWKDYTSLPLNMTSGGYNCYWPMPFHKSARITLENRAPIRIDSLYYNIDVETHPTLPKETLYFHAQFRRANPTQRGRPVTILETTGQGQYVGTLLSMQALRGRGIGFLEGDEQVTVDNEAKPSILGTGTEDYFSSGWYFDTGVYSAPYHGVTIKDEALGRINAYRWHIEDAIPFTRSLRFNIEHGAANDVSADYSSVAFYYQTHPHPLFPPLPRDLMPRAAAEVPHVPGMIEGESLLPSAKATAGVVEVQDMSGFEDDWSGLSQLWWHSEAAGTRLTLTLNAPAAQSYELIGYFTRAADYGDVQATVNGQTLAPIVRGYHDGVVLSGPISFGRVPLKAGANQVTLEVVGKDAHAKSYLVGLDGFVLKP